MASVGQIRVYEWCWSNWGLCLVLVKLGFMSGMCQTIILIEMAVFFLCIVEISLILYSIWGL